MCIFLPGVKDVNVLLERERSEGISSPSRDDDSTLLNPGTHSSVLDDNTKSDAGLPEVSDGAPRSLCSLDLSFLTGVVYEVVFVKVTVI